MPTLWHLALLTPLALICPSVVIVLAGFRTKRARLSVSCYSIVSSVYINREAEPPPPHHRQLRHRHNRAARIKSAAINQGVSHLKSKSSPLISRRDSTRIAIAKAAISATQKTLFILVALIGRHLRFIYVVVCAPRVSDAPLGFLISCALFKHTERSLTVECARKQ